MCACIWKREESSEDPPITRISSHFLQISFQNRVVFFRCQWQDKKTSLLSFEDAEGETAKSGWGREECKCVEAGRYDIRIIERRKGEKRERWEIPPRRCRQTRRRKDDEPLCFFNELKKIIFASLPLHYLFFTRCATINAEESFVCPSAVHPTPYLFSSNKHLFHTLIPPPPLPFRGLSWENGEMYVNA